jgi:hypothetical protein
VYEDMAMFDCGTVVWTDEAKMRIATSTAEIARRLKVDHETANDLWERMASVCEVMATKGLCAYPGGEQSAQVIPEALDLIRTRAGALHD